jgi:hypothetical protein
VIDKHDFLDDLNVVVVVDEGIETSVFDFFRLDVEFVFLILINLINE